MSNLNETIKGFHHQIEKLEGTIDDKNIELRVIENDLQETLSPSIIGSEITLTIMEMLLEVVEFTKLKGESERTTASKNRLIWLLNKTEQLNTLSKSINTLKLINRDIHRGYQKLRTENITLKQQLKNTEDAEQY